MISPKLQNDVNQQNRVNIKLFFKFRDFPLTLGFEAGSFLVKGLLQLFKRLGLFGYLLRISIFS